ncbi:hypothetical protein SISSUDRAFT_1028260 [Sistotremastrum suecicum HHB10207 ss-3]|uniref:Uncharacterized protein n=1 Tax=Sistotremastrum suecicum HHB10207 ss-3 TaxID=1314776 RepID=A0A165Y0P8_9AGAM|nr:hypothetical protein SISSUDRAFT_1028260 [Sistotremastrum suecicum HHB10207 ss-3]
MIFIWLPKRWLAKTLDSSSLQAEATCSLSCIQITLVLFVGSLVYKLWKGGWWVDGATSIVLGLLFGWEGYKMIKWVRDPNFDGGCCGSCKPTTGVLATAELGEQYRDLCQCCSEKSECRDSNECKCAGEDAQSQTESCCQPTKNDGSKCCSHEMVQGRKPTARSSADQRRVSSVPSLWQLELLMHD